MYKLLFFKCPVCRKPINLKAKLPENNDLERLVLKHEDHYILLEYDKRGTIRTLTVFKSYTGKEGRKVVCPKCQKVEYIPREVEEIDRYAFDHDEHAFLVYIILGKVAYDVLPIFKIGKPVLPENVISKIVKITSVEYLASVITEIIITDTKYISVDSKVHALMNCLFNKIWRFKRVQIIEGSYSVKSDLPLRYFLNIINEVKDLPEYEAIERLNKQIELVENLLDTIRRTYQLGPMMVEPIINSIRNENLKDLLLAALARRYEIVL